ncbi:unnamed protein product [Allacma fusca]|uniref:Uncharacterized protein n=1 Tax=Allacma fusca TaxID=39272 RepID=A0A8J2LL59_9HEXA|nr:unnamed protein product [Allacma fusca]
MQKLIVAFLATCALCSAAVTRNPFVLEDNNWSILRCNDGNLTGLDDFAELFQTVVQECENKDSSKAFYECICTTLAITEEDGTPSLEKMTNLFVILFSETILEDVPTFKQELTTCAKDYVSNFNEIGEVAESSETFFKCFTDTIQNSSAAIVEACKLEWAFNQDYFIKTHSY